ncbi:MAG: hypothetical protein GWP19_00295 [Planctomycetia bacterium]|nr:hypothetical protein [Planctomycetia bacterium]
MKVIKGDLILTENYSIDEDLKVEGNIICKGGKWNLNCWNLNCNDLNCNDLNCWDLNCWDLNCGDLNCGDLNCGNLNCWDLRYYAVAFAYNTFKCKSAKSGRANAKHFCLDNKIVYKNKICNRCGAELK